MQNRACSLSSTLKIVPILNHFQICKLLRNTKNTGVNTHNNNNIEFLSFRETDFDNYQIKIYITKKSLFLLVDYEFLLLYG